MIKKLEDQRIIRRRDQLPQLPSEVPMFRLTRKEVDEHKAALKLLADKKKAEEKDKALALQLAREQVEDPALKRTPIDYQRQLLEDFQKAADEAAKVSDETVEWSKEMLTYRSRPSKIVKVHIRGRKYSGTPVVELDIFRDTGVKHIMYAETLKKLGLPEWLEVKKAISGSRSKFKNHVEKILNSQIELVSSAVKIPPSILSPPQQKRASDKKKKPIDPDSGPPIRNETDIGFSREEVLGRDADISMLDTSLPPGEFAIVGKFVTDPCGIYFEDQNGKMHFQRASELPIAPIEQLRDLISLCYFKDRLGSYFLPLIHKEVQRRKDLNEDIPEWMLPNAFDELQIKEESE